MKVIRSNQRLPRPALLGLAFAGWLAVLYLCYVVGSDSWQRTKFSIVELTRGLPELDPFNQRYADHPILTLFHTIPGLLFSILGPLQFMSPVRRKVPRLHRISGRLFLLIAMSSGIAAILMGLRFPMWGWSVNQAVALVWAGFMLFAFCKAFLHVRSGDYQLHREWMIRGFSAGLGVALFRVLLNHLLPRMGFEFTEAWNVVSVISAPLILSAAEFWIRVTRSKARGRATALQAQRVAG